MHGSVVRRTLSVQDLPWALHLAYERYPPFDPGAAVVFYLNAMKSPRALKLRTSDAFLIGSVMSPAWRPTELQFHVLVLCCAQGHHWEGVGLLRESVAWSKAQRCESWWFTSDMISTDVRALCRRVGAKSQERFGILF